MHQELLQVMTNAARDDLRRAAEQQWRLPHHIGPVLADLSHSVSAIERILLGLRAHVGQPQDWTRATCLDGPFSGDLPAAQKTAFLWLASAEIACLKLKDCIDNTHIALAGIAEID